MLVMDQGIIMLLDDKRKAIKNNLQPADLHNQFYFVSVAEFRICTS